MTGFHFHVCDNCFAILTHKEMSPAPCSHHDCKKCGEEVDRNGYTTMRSALAAAKTMKQQVTKP